MKKSLTTLAIVAGLIVLAGCGAVAPPSPAPTVEPAGPSASPADQSGETTSEPDAPSRSERGNLVKEVGETFGYGPSEAAPFDVAAFRVTNIEAEASCSTEHAEEPRNGHFVRFDIEGETSANLHDAVGGDLFLGADSWKVIAENGTTFNGDVASLPAWTCLEDVDMLPVKIGPAERVAGSVVLDVPTSTGIAILDPFGGGGWEWTF